MGGYAVKFEEVYKEFPLYHQVAAQGVKSFLLHARQSLASLKRSTFVALKGLSFEVPRGETVGIIGVNGSGKSTVLGLMAGVLKPDRGKVHVDGRVSSLLELGAGFHPELSGEENIILNGNLLGLTTRDIRKRMDRIVEFSGLEDFIYQPVRTYSSGMYARLGFSVAAHIEHEILLIDEVIAVGDAVFQERCVDKIAEIKRSGATIVIASHDMSMIGSICDRAVWIDEGRAKAEGNPKVVVESYLTGIGRRMGLSEHHPAGAVGVKEAQVSEVVAEEEKTYSWWDSPLILKHVEQLITGDEDVNFYRFLRREYVPASLGRGLCIRSRLSGVENNFVKGGVCKEFDVIEVSPDSKSIADDVIKAAARQQVLSGGHAYDLLFTVDVLGKMKDQQGFLREVKKAMTPHGLVLCLERIASDDGKTKEQEEILALFDALLPEKYKSPALAAGQPDVYDGCSGGVVSSLKGFFAVDAVKYLGGSLYGRLFSRISTGFDVFEAEAAGLMRVVLDFEQVLIGKGMLTNEYALVIARNEI